MSEQTDICTLDYLVGTIATAYKGMVTSLVAKDFCISSGVDKTVFKGTVISLPEGTYNISLMHGGHEVIRSSLREGFFELEAENALTSAAGNLQLDVTQNGKHIGTFLLRKEKSGDFYSSAMELSEELRGINFRYLNEQLHDHTGLQKKAESIISAVLSTKKDWKKLSDDINTLSKDLFWTDTDAFINWYEFFVRFSARSAKNSRKKFETKALSNLLNLMELPLEKEMAGDKLQAVADIWIREISEGAPNLALRFKNYVKVLHRLRKAMPDVDIRPAVRLLFDSLDSLITVATFIDEEVLVIFRNKIAVDEVKPLEHFGADYRETIFSQILSNRERLKDHNATSDVLDAVDSIDPTVLDSGEMIRTLFSLMKRHIDALSSADLATIMNNVSEITKHISRDVYKYAILQLTRILDKLIAAEKIDHAHVILEFVGKADETLRDDVVFNTEACAAILRSENNDLIALYEDILLKIIIPPPSISGFSDQTWEELSNPVHLMRLKGFIDIVGLAPERLRKVMIHFIAMLYINDIFIPDDAIFQREISAYLNSADLENDFLLHYLLLRKFPVYFHEVGASGMIRDLTTEIDAWGNDPVIYFLRKQVHVNASNHNIDLIESIIRSWTFGKAELLRETVPREIYDSIDPEVIATYSSTITPLFETLGILETGILKIKKILHIPDEEIADTVERMQSTDEIRSKILLICKTYKSIVKKYARTDVSNGSIALTGLVSELTKLKKIFSSAQRTEAQESFYYKRHIAFGIPSVIGSYHEPKFDAFGEMLRIEDRIRVVIEGIISDVDSDKETVTEDILEGWLRSLHEIHALFELHGLSNPMVTEVIDIIKSNRLYISQIKDLLREWQTEVTWMVELVYRTFHKPLTNILSSLPENEIPESLLRPGGTKETYINKAVDVLIRDILNSITGFEELDRLLNCLIKYIGGMVESGQDIAIALPDSPVVSKDLYTFKELNEKEAASLSPYLGNKAKNLVVLFNEGLQVPFGVTFSSIHSKDFHEYTGSATFTRTLKDAVQQIERETGLKLGDKERPLLVSVRSGAYISMPGILSSILYCGSNETTINAFGASTGDPWLAWDSYRRFIEHYSTVVHRIPDEVLEGLSRDVLSRNSVKNVRDLNVEQLKMLIGKYMNLLAEKGMTIPDDTFEQLRQSVAAIYRSWTDEKALQYRKAMSVSEHWGTAVTIIPMITANSKNAGASVFFTHDPYSNDKGVFGETRRMATGDDIVYGKLSSRPIARAQITDDSESLEDFDPDLYNLHLEAADRIEQAMGNVPQEVEAAYTIDKTGKRTLFILQTRRMEFRRGYIEKFQDICRMESSIIGRGIGVHGGALSGIATLSDNPEHIRKLRSDFNEPVILLRHETSTDDVALMPEIDGIITSVGGATSHAAILAQKFDLTAVVGCSDMSIRTDDHGHKYALIGDFELYEGTALSIDGSSGIAYSGVCLLTVKEDNY